ncbi:hypothetical protein PG993_002861 [Apiospora rasikravindrae]|uniref:No apical meristem-associated C-terminal domain-containing protein n=1 Tax=Apiospora rasikravindrae TaxID=990691 RepID=A0ABR1TXW1_9PEZI
MNEDEWHQLHTMAQGPEEIVHGEQKLSRWNMLVFTANVVRRPGDKSKSRRKHTTRKPGAIVPPKAPHLSTEDIPGHPCRATGVAGGLSEPQRRPPAQAPPFANREHTRTPLPGHGRGGSPRQTPTPSSFEAQVAPAAPSPNTEADPAQTPQPTAARLSKVNEHKKKRGPAGDVGQTKKRNTTANEGMLSEKIATEGMANPQKGGSKTNYCLVTQYNDNPKILDDLRNKADEAKAREAAEARKAASEEAAATQANPHSPLSQNHNPEGASGSEIPNETNLDKTNELPG